MPFRLFVSHCRQPAERFQLSTFRHARHYADTPRRVSGFAASASWPRHDTMPSRGFTTAAFSLWWAEQLPFSPWRFAIAPPPPVLAIRGLLAAILRFHYEPGRLSLRHDISLLAFHFQFYASQPYHFCRHTRFSRHFRRHFQLISLPFSAFASAAAFLRIYFFREPYLPASFRLLRFSQPSDVFGRRFHFVTLFTLIAFHRLLSATTAEPPLLDMMLLH